MVIGVCKKIFFQRKDVLDEVVTSRRIPGNGKFSEVILIFRDRG